MAHIRMSHVTHVNDSYYTYGQEVNESCHTYDESCHTYELVISYIHIYTLIWMSLVTHTYAHADVNESFHVYTCKEGVHESCHICICTQLYEWVMSHIHMYTLIWMSHVIHTHVHTDTADSCYTYMCTHWYEWVMSYIHMYTGIAWVMSHTHVI